MSVLVSHNYINTNFQVRPGATPLLPTHTGLTSDIDWIETNYYAYTTGNQTSNRCPDIDQIFAIPNITTTSPTIINTSTVNDGGSVSNNIGTVTQVGMCLSSTNTVPSQYDTITFQYNSVNITAGYSWFSTLSYTFTPGILYYLRAYVLYNGVYYYGNNVVTVNTVTNPDVTTTIITNINITTASGGGDVISDGGSTVTSRGVCWNTSLNPTISNSHTTNGTGTGTFSSLLSGLTASTTYHVRAYATNSFGTGYGADVTFITSNNPTSLPNERQSSTVSASWSGVDMTSDGYKQVASIFNGQIYGTIGYCQPWTVINSTSRAYRDIAMNDDGSIIISNVTGGQIYKTTNFGSSWSTVGNIGNWNDIAISSTGQYAGVVSNDGVVNISNDYCATWTSVSIPGTSSLDPFTDITISGSYMVICSSSGTKSIYLSNNYGASGSWSQIGPSNTYPWNDLAMNGSKIVAVTSNGYTFYSDNYGATFVETDYQAGINWRGVDTNDGNYWIRAGASTNFNYSTNGITWSQLTNSARNWNDITLSSDGSYRTAVDSGGYIYTFNDNVCPTTTTTTSTSTTTTTAEPSIWYILWDNCQIGLPNTQSGPYTYTQVTNLYVYNRRYYDGSDDPYVMLNYADASWGLSFIVPSYTYNESGCPTTTTTTTSTTTTTQPPGAGYYNCGYGCCYYNYDPGCTPCLDPISTISITDESAGWSIGDVYFNNNLLVFDEFGESVITSSNFGTHELTVSVNGSSQTGYCLVYDSNGTPQCQDYNGSSTTFIFSSVTVLSCISCIILIGDGNCV